MKKAKLCILFVLPLLLCAIFLTGCGRSIQKLVKNNMAEMTEHYFSYEDDEFSLSLSLGKREEPYMIDGIANKNVNFSLFNFRDKSGLLKDDSIACEVIIDGAAQQINLQYNPVSDRFIYDLGEKIAPNAQISFKFGEKTVRLANLSDNFYLTAQQALKLSVEHFSDILKSYSSNGYLFGESYIKVMGSAQSDSLFWAYSFVGRDGKTFNCIVSTKDGKIIASD